MSIFNPFFRSDDFSIFEIYPQNEIPLLTRIAHLDFFLGEYPAHLLPDTLICPILHEDKIAFRVVDYRTNYSICISTNINVENVESELDIKVFFVLSKTLKLVSNHILARHLRRRQLLSSSVKKKY